MGINQDVLQPLGLLEAERTHPVARFAGADRKGRPHEGCVEVSDLVAGLERCWIAAAGDGRHNAPTPTLPRKAGEGITARRAGGLDLPEPGIGNEAADGATLESRRQLGEGVAVPGNVLGKARHLGDEEAILLAEDVGGAGQQLARGRIEGVDRREERLTQPVAGETRVRVGRVAAGCEMEPAQVGLDVVPRDVEQRPGKVAVAPAHRAEPARTAAAKQVEEEGLHLVIPRVAERDGGAVRLGCRLPEEGMPGGRGGVSRVRGAGRRARGMKVKAPRRRHRGDEVAIILAVGPPTVVEMRDGEMKRQCRKNLAQDGKQRQRVGSARHRDHHTPARLEDAMQTDGDGHAARMLDVARAKDVAGRVQWVRGSAYRLPVADGTAGLVVMVMVIHLLRQRTRAFGEARRVLRPGERAGQLCIWTFTPRHVEEFYLNAFFPSIAIIDRPRFPAVDVLSDELRRAGLARIRVEVREEVRRMEIAEVVDRVRGRYISTLAMLPPLEYRLGLQRLEEMLAQDRTIALSQRSEWAIITARK